MYLRCGRAGDGRGSHPARSAAALTTAMSRGAFKLAQAEGDRVRTGRGGDLVDKGFAGGLDLRADRVEQMRRAALST